MTELHNNTNIIKLLHSFWVPSLFEWWMKHMIKNILSFHFISEAWHFIKLIFLLRQKAGMQTHSLFSAFSFFSRDSKKDQRHRLRCQSCWSKRLDRSPFSTTFLIRLFIRDQAQAWGSIRNSQAMNPFFWLFALLSLLPLVLATRSRGIVIRLQQPDGRVLHRSKRDWMWRQFFLSEEYTGSNYQYVGKVRDSTIGPSSFILHPCFHPHHPQPAYPTGTDFQTRPRGGKSKGMKKKLLWGLCGMT